MSFPETVDLNTCGATLTIGSSYDASYTTPLGLTTVSGVVTISCGTLIADGLTIQ
jgi:hypothetical protein